MTFWSHPLIPTALGLLGLLLIGELIRWLIPPLARYGVPASILGGTVGLVVGGSGLGWLPLDGEVMEAGVYHALGLVFIAVSLRTPEKGGGKGARAMAFGFTWFLVLQAAIGLAVVVALGMARGEPMHPGFGLMLPMAFEEGPGQALAMGAAWETGGMPDGAQVGLIMAAAGFAWAILIGVPFVAWGRAKGLVSPHTAEVMQAERAAPEPEPPPGSAELLTRHLAIIAVLYAITWAVCAGLAHLFRSDPEMAAMAWGFHFIFGALIAMAARPLINRLPGGSPLHDPLLGRIAASIVDVATVAALAAVQLAVLSANWLPILLITSLGGLATLAFSLWVARRAFPQAPFEHAVLLFGTSTGTLPTGLALLRMVDPELNSPAPTSAVVGAGLAVIGFAPVLMLIVPIPIAGWADDPMGSTLLGLGLMLAYAVVTLVGWVFLGGLKLRKAA